MCYCERGKTDRPPFPILVLALRCLVHSTLHTLTYREGKRGGGDGCAGRMAEERMQLGVGRREENPFFSKGGKRKGGILMNPKFLAQGDIVSNPPPLLPPFDERL